MSVFSKFYNSSSPSFPLYKLPILAQDEILKTMSPIELLILSRTSYKLKSVIKNHKVWKRFRKIILTIDGKGFSFGFSVADGDVDKIVVKPRKYKHVIYKNLFEGDSTTKVKYEKCDMKTYWTDVSIGIETIGDRILDMFHLHLVPTLHIHIYAWPVEQIDKVVHWIQSKSSMEVHSCTVNRFPKQEEIEYYLRDLKGPQKFYRAHQPSLYIALSSEELAMNSLGTMDPEILSLNDTNLSSGELNYFLKSWIEGGPKFNRIKFFHLGSSYRFRRDDILRGLEYERKPSTLKRSYFETQPHEIAGGYDIERDNGVTATIQIGRHAFKMMVWPDFEGKAA